MNLFELFKDGIIERSKLKGVLSDAFKEDRLKANIILTAYDAEIVETLAKSDVVDGAVLTRIMKKLINEFGLSAENAEWVATFWIDNYAVAILKKVKEISQRKQTDQTANASFDLSQKGFTDAFVEINKLRKNDKIPKNFIVWDCNQDSKYKIDQINCTIIKEYDADSDEQRCYLKVNGEYIGKPNKELLLFPMAFNTCGEMIGVCLDIELKKNKKNGTFSGSMTVPNDERISQVFIRLAYDPTWVD